METLDIPTPTAPRGFCYDTCDNINNARVLKDCISKGDGTPVQLEDLYCTDNMERYRQSVPAFRYNDTVFPPYGYTIHHWYIRTYGDTFESLITDSREEILDYIDNAFGIVLAFVPLPNTLHQQCLH